MTSTTQQKKHTKLVVMILLDIVIIAALIIYFGIVRPERQNHNLNEVKIDGVFLTTPTHINNFNLTDNHGQLFTKDNLKGHWTLMFFGFTNCGMVCPTTMVALNKMYTSLQKELPSDQLPQVAFISVDPDRDSVERVNEYITSFNSHFIGARAEIAETIALEKQLHIAAAKMQADGQGKEQYTINHSAEILLINPEAQLQAYFSYPHQPEKMSQDYKLILSTYKG